jgi:hypothetical protein
MMLTDRGRLLLFAMLTAAAAWLVCIRVCQWVLS